MTSSSLHTQILFPEVPAGEEDPRARINVLRQLFNDSQKPDNSSDRGLYHEICTALFLFEFISHGRQISRTLTPAEKIELGKGAGQTQMIMAPRGDGQQGHRELDMVCEKDGTTYIVEAKVQKKTDSHQLRPNIYLAHRLGWGVMYAMRNSGQKKAIEDNGNKIFAELRASGALNVPPLLAFPLDDRVADLLYKSPDKKGQSLKKLGLLTTMVEIKDQSQDWMSYLGLSEWDMDAIYQQEANEEGRVTPEELAKFIAEKRCTEHTDLFCKLSLGEVPCCPNHFLS